MIRYIRLAALLAVKCSVSLAWAQTWTACNPLYQSCPPDPALGTSINVDFTQGSSSASQFTASGGMVTYSSSDGVGFTVSGSGQAPQLTSNFYIMFGRVEVTTRAAPGNGIVSSVVLQSDCLDEIDFEWLGADAQQVQTNYFGKGNTASYTRGLFHATPNNQADYLVYTIDWTADRIVWSVGSTVVRTLTYAGAEANQYPQTPMQVKFGSWSGGDPANAPGTIEWARGPTNYAAGPFTMYVKNIKITDYSTGTQYRYGDMTGSWQSIVADGGQVNGNLGASGSPYTTPTTTNGGSGSTGGNPGPAVSPTIPNLPSGWVMRPDGKIVPVGSASFRPPFVFSTILISLITGVLLIR